MAHDGIISVRPKISTAASLSISAGVITRRGVLANKLLVAAVKEVPSMTEARTLERHLKSKKNPQLAILALNSKKT